jgi:hypothetical protein
MMLGGGAIDAMKKSYENNRNLLGRRKKLKELIDEQGISHHHTKYTFKKADPESLKKLHTRLIIENRTSLLKQVGILVFLTMIIFGAIYFFVF